MTGFPAPHLFCGAYAVPDAPELLLQHILQKIRADFLASSSHVLRGELLQGYVLGCYSYHQTHSEVPDTEARSHGGGLAQENMRNTCTQRRSTEPCSRNL